MNCPPHHWLLDAPTPEGTPSTCNKCGAEKTWPPPDYQALADGRPFLLKDPLLARTHLNSVGGYRRTTDYW